MRWMSYQALTPIGTGLIIFATAFGLGAVYGNLPYDYETLWAFKGDLSVFDDSITHYKQWASAPMRVHHIFHAVCLIGLAGSIIKIYKPPEDLKYFEYGSMGLLFLAIIIYLTNIRIGANSAYYDSWGEVSRETGLNVIGASQFMIVVALVGVLILQGGLYFAEWYDGELKKEFFAQEAAELEAAKKAGSIDEKETKDSDSKDASASGAQVSETKPKKKSKKSTK